MGGSYSLSAVKGSVMMAEHLYTTSTRDFSTFGCILAVNNLLSIVKVKLYMMDFLDYKNV